MARWKHYLPALAGLLSGLLSHTGNEPIPVLRRADGQL
jgi:hypothetical protein